MDLEVAAIPKGMKFVIIEENYFLIGSYIKEKRWSIWYEMFLQTIVVVLHRYS